MFSLCLILNLWKPIDFLSPLLEKKNTDATIFKFYNIVENIDISLTGDVTIQSCHYSRAVCHNFLTRSRLDKILL